MARASSWPFECRHHDGRGVRINQLVEDIRAQLLVRDQSGCTQHRKLL